MHSKRSSRGQAGILLSSVVIRGCKLQWLHAAKSLENKSAHHSNSLVQEGRARRTAKGLQPGCAAGAPARQKCVKRQCICPPQGAQGQPSQILNSAPGLQAQLSVRLRSAQAGPMLGFRWHKPEPWGPPHQAAQQQDGARRRSYGKQFAYATPYPTHLQNNQIGASAGAEGGSGLLSWPAFLLVLACVGGACS